jgi:cell division protein FtsW
MARRLKSDIVLVWATLALVIVSLAWVYSASAVRADRAHNDPGYVVVRQAVWAMAGIVCLLAAMRLDYRLYRRRIVLVAMLAVTTLALLVVYFLPAVKNSHRWLGIGTLGVQPSEFAKLAAIVFVAATLEEWLERREAFRPVIARVGAVAGGFFLLIVFEPDLGSAATLAAVVCAMLFVAGISYRWVAGMAASAPPLVALFVWLEPYRAHRILAFWDPWRDREGAGFQVVQSFIAVGSGGVFGKGFMNSVQKLFYLPEAHNDFIFAVIAEEQGLIGASVVLALFAVIVWRGLRAARRAPDAYGSLLATGITAMLGLQALGNISVVLGLVPAKGIALPFVSAGGSSMAASLAAMGILLNVSQHGIDWEQRARTH